MAKTIVTTDVVAKALVAIGIAEYATASENSGLNDSSPALPVQPTQPTFTPNYYNNPPDDPTITDDPSDGFDTVVAFMRWVNSQSSGSNAITLNGLGVKGGFGPPLAFHTDTTTGRIVVGGTPPDESEQVITPTEEG